LVLAVLAVRRGQIQLAAMADEADKPLAVTAEQLGITFK
jgi:hypothetical protein